MRQIGTLPSTLDPRVFGDYLLSIGVSSRVVPGDNGHAVWVHDEDKVELARREFLAYEQEPTHPRYTAAVPTARAVREAEERRDREFRKNNRQVNFNQQKLNFRRRPVTLLLMAACLLVYVVSLAGPRWEGMLLDQLGFFPLAAEADATNFTGALDAIRHGEVWRLITPIFIHFGMMHIAFNMLAMLALGTAIEYTRGWRVLLGLTLASAVASNVGQYLYDVNFSQRLVEFGGISGVAFALFGYIWMKGELAPEVGMRLSPASVRYMLLWLILGFTGVLERTFGVSMANGAHLVGLLVGVLFGIAGV